MSDDPLTDLVRRDPRYRRGAYDFVREALRFAIERAGEHRHVSARELLESFRLLAREEFGFLARTVLDDWGVRSTEDVGNIVFNLIEVGDFNKTEDDRLSHFSGVWSFDEAFPDEDLDARVHDSDEDDVWADDDDDDDADESGDADDDAEE